MKLLRRLTSSWHGALAGVIALAIYLVSPPVLRWLDPTASLFDGGYLQWVIMATFLSFWAVFVGWVVWQIAFPSLDEACATKSDEWGGLRSWWEYLTPPQRWVAVQVTFVLCVGLFLICLKLVPMS